MKRWIVLLLCILLTGCVQTYDGPVEEKLVLTSCVYESYYQPTPQSASQVWCTTEERYTYDIYGNRAQVRKYQDGELTNEERSRFDDRGNRISTDYIDHTGWFPLAVSHEESTFDEENRRTSFTQRDFWFREEYSYQFRYEGDRTTTTFRSDGRETISWDQQVLDEAGRVQKQLGNGGYWSQFFYDAAGNNIRKEQWENETLLRYYEYTYDDQGRMLSHAGYQGDGTPLLHNTYSYEEFDSYYTVTMHRQDGLRTEEQYSTEGNLVTVTDYDSTGNILAQKRCYYDHIEVPKEGSP